MNLIEKVKNLLESKPQSLPLHTAEDAAVALEYKRLEKQGYKAPKPTAAKPQVEKSSVFNILQSLEEVIEPPSQDRRVTLRALCVGMGYDTPEYQQAKKIMGETKRTWSALSAELNGFGQDFQGQRFAAQRAVGGELTKATFRDAETGKRSSLRVKMQAESLRCAKACRPVNEDFKDKAEIFISALAAAEKKRCADFSVTYRTPSLVVGLRYALKAFDKSWPDEALALVSPDNMLPFT